MILILLIMSGLILANLSASVEQEDYRLKEIKIRKIQRTYSNDDLKNIEAEINALTIKRYVFDKEFYQNAIKKDPFVLKIIPKEIIDSELCELAVSKCKWTLKYVPDEFKSDELCFKAIFNQPKVIKYASSAILNNNEFINLLLDNLTIHIYYLPESLITYDRCYEYIKNEKFCLLQDIPEKYKDKKICELAFSKNMSNIQFFPQEYQSIDLWIRAIEKDKTLLKHIPDIYVLDKEFYLSKIEEDPMCFLYISNEKRDFDMCVTALAKCKQIIDEEEGGLKRKYLFKWVYDKIPQNWRNKVCLYIDINERKLDFYLK